MTEPNEFDELRQRQELQERRREFSLLKSRSSSTDA